MPGLSLTITAARALISIGSPSGVPSSVSLDIVDLSSSPMSGISEARLGAASLVTVGFGAKKLALLPPCATSTPRMTACISLPHDTALSMRFSTTTPQPSARTSPSARSSKVWHRPVGEVMPCSGIPIGSQGREHCVDTCHNRHLALGLDANC